MCLASTCLGWSPPQNLSGCSCFWELLQSQCLSECTPGNSILKWHSLQPTKLLFLTDDASYVLCFDSVRGVSQDTSDLGTLLLTPSHPVVYQWAKGLFHPFQDIFASNGQMFCLGSLWSLNRSQVGVCGILYSDRPKKKMINVKAEAYGANYKV